MDAQKCQRCGEGADPDLRTVRMSCGYDMDELGLPFMKLWNPDVNQNFYSLRVCKNCRATWMIAIRRWFNEPQHQQEVGSGIFVRRMGANVEVSEEEWRRENPGREPVRVKP